MTADYVPFSEVIEANATEPAFEQRWLCDVPALGVRFTVLEEEWIERDGDLDLRVIKAVRLA